jgi:plasmid maintenance system antidote protein VapI
MNSTHQLIERVRTTTDTRSDYAVAKALGITPQRISRYLRGLDEIHDDAAITRAAELIGDDPAALLAEFQAERAKSENARRAWRRLAVLAREHAAAALLLGVGMGATVSPSPAVANAAATCVCTGSGALPQCILC